jgi:RNA polymerase sigma-70 factor (ECF subfamily)
MGETELIARCVNKEPLAWAQFIRRYSPLVHWAIRDRLKKWGYPYHPQDVEEIHQDIFLSLWEKEKLTQLRDRSRVAPWLVVMAGNEAIDHFRRKKSLPPDNAVSIFEEIPQMDNATMLADILASPAVNQAEQDQEYENMEKLLGREIDRLAPREKIIIKLNVLHNKKYREIAEIMHMPLGSVASSIKNIKYRLRQRISEKIKNSKIKQPLSASYIVGGQK